MVAKKKAATKKPVTKKKVTKKKVVKKEVTRYGLIKYKRTAPLSLGVPRNFIKQGERLAEKFPTGTILEFQYGKKQVYGEVGGWKNDPKPVLLIFYDDNFNYIEGLNTNYLSDHYLLKLRQIIVRFPGVIDKAGKQLYKIVKRTAPFALAKGYRKYIRTSLRNAFTYHAKEK